MRGLINELQEVSGHIPLNWGKVQNNKSDDILDLWSIHSIKQLNQEAIEAGIGGQDYKYFLRRWYLWKCAEIDEALFCALPNCEPNTTKNLKAFDIEFNNSKDLRFDVKSTRFPKKFWPPEPGEAKEELIKWLYNEQSKGRRKGLQNRLFILHHSHKGDRQTLRLRVDFTFKYKVFKEFSKQIEDINFVNYKGAKATSIHIIENKDGSKEFYFSGLNAPLV